MAAVEQRVGRNGDSDKERTDQTQQRQTRDRHRHVRRVHAARRAQQDAAAVPGHAREATGRADVRVEADLRRRRRAQQRRVHRPEQPVRRRAARRGDAAEVREENVPGAHPALQRVDGLLLHQGVVRTHVRGRVRPGGVQRAGAAEEAGVRLSARGWSARGAYAFAGVKHIASHSPASVDTDRAEHEFRRS